jgi:hypothetical protein
LFIIQFTIYTDTEITPYTAAKLMEKYLLFNIAHIIYLTSRFSWMKLSILNKQKGKAIPLQALTGLEGSSRLRLPDFKTIST